MSAKPGYQFRLYYSASLVNSGGTGGSWSHNANCTDLDMDPSIDALDATTRGSAGIKEYVAGLLDVKITWKQLFDLDDTIATALQTAFYARTTIALNVHSGDRATSGEKGVLGNFIITKWKPAPPIDGLAAFEAEAMPAVNSYVQQVTT